MGIGRVERVEACRTCKVWELSRAFVREGLRAGGDFNAKRRESEVGL